MSDLAVSRRAVPCQVQLRRAYDEQVLRCPRCHRDGAAFRTAAADLVTERIHDGAGNALRIDRCPKCRGFFVARSALEGVLGKPVELAAWAQRGSVTPGGPSEIGCPPCRGRRMELHHVHVRDKRVAVDVCRTCLGVWLDPGELWPLVDAARGKPEAPIVVTDDVPLPPTAVEDALDMLGTAIAFTLRILFAITFRL